MSWLGLIAGAVALVWADALFWVGLSAVYKRRRLARRTRTPPTPPPGPVVLLRPCAGDEPHLGDCLRSVTAMRCATRPALLFAVDSLEDGALPVLRAVSEELRAAGWRAEVTVLDQPGANRKAALLAAAVRERGSQFAVLVNADSNVDLAGVDLDRLVAPLAGDVGAVWVPPVEAGGPACGNRASVAVLSGSLHAFPLLCALDPRGLVGKLFACRLDALTRLELESLPDYLGEDMELARRLAQRHLEVEPLPAVVVSRVGSKSVAETVDRHARWFRVIRGQRPALWWSLPLLFATTPLLWPLAALGFLYHAALGAGALALALLARGLIGAAARRFAGDRAGPLTLLCDAWLGDLVLLAAWWRSRGDEVVWRGRRLRLGRDGRLERA